MTRARILRSRWPGPGRPKTRLITRTLSPGVSAGALRFSLRESLPGGRWIERLPRLRDERPGLLHGVLRTFLRHQLILAGHRLGVPPARLAEWR